MDAMVSDVRSWYHNLILAETVYTAYNFYDLRYVAVRGNGD